MENKRLLDSLSADYGRLREVALAADPGAEVPSCPGWSITDLVQHVGMVYLHKVECMRLGDHPAEWPPPEAQAEPPLELLTRAYAQLADEFAARPAEERTFTWYEPDRTVGFWIRRMAQETVIHRVDAELAAGMPIMAIPDDIALDGIDELLVTFVEYGSHRWLEDYGDALATADGRAVRLEAQHSAWLVRPRPEGVEVRVSDVDACAAVVRGEPRALLLWLWNRAGDEAVTVTGDVDLVTRLRKVIVASTQ